MAEIELDRAEARQGRLPDVCVYCGAPAVTHSRKTFVGRSPFLILGGAGLMQVRAPVCAAHRFASAWRIGLTAVLFLAWFALLALVAWLDPKNTVPDWLAPLQPYRGPLILVMLGLFAATITWRVIAFYTDVRLVDVTRDTITLGGVSDDFVDACYEPQPVRPAPRQARQAAGAELLVPELVEDEDESEAPRRKRRPARRRTSSGLIFWLVGVGVLLLLAVPVGVAIVALTRTRPPAPPAAPAEPATPVRLAQPRVTADLGMATHVKVDYSFAAAPQPDSKYTLVVEAAGQRRGQRVFPGNELQQAGTLDVDLLGRGGGPLELYLEEAGPGGERQRVSNTMRLP